MKKKPDLPDSVIEWQWLVSNQLLTNNKLKLMMIKEQGEVSYGIIGGKLFSPVKIRTWLDTNH